MGKWGNGESGRGDLAPTLTKIKKTLIVPINNQGFKVKVGAKQAVSRPTQSTILLNICIKTDVFYHFSVSSVNSVAKKKKARGSGVHQEVFQEITYPTDLYQDHNPFKKARKMSKLL